jgi:hypothetical protein
MMTLTPRCLAPTTLTFTEFQFLTALPNGMNEIQVAERCGLEAGHPGAHAKNVQDTVTPGANGTSTAHKYWLRWTDQPDGGAAAGGTGAGRDIVELPPCSATVAETEAEAAETAQEEPVDRDGRQECLLFAGHPSRHDFDLVDWPHLRF